MSLFLYVIHFTFKYKSILRTKITARKLNMTSTYQLQPAKYGSQIVNKNTLHHYLVNKIKI
jgi:hypothetical protein